MKRDLGFVANTSGATIGSCGNEKWRDIEGAPPIAEEMYRATGVWAYALDWARYIGKTNRSDAYSFFRAKEISSSDWSYFVSYPRSGLVEHTASRELEVDCLKLLNGWLAPAFVGHETESDVLVVSYLHGDSLSRVIGNSVAPFSRRSKFREVASYLIQVQERLAVGLPMACCNCVGDRLISEYRGHVLSMDSQWKQRLSWVPSFNEANKCIQKGDTGIGNVLVGDDGVPHFIDFEDVGFGPQAYDAIRLCISTRTGLSGDDVASVALGSLRDKFGRALSISDMQDFWTCFLVLNAVRTAESLMYQFNERNCHLPPRLKYFSFLAQECESPAIRSTAEIWRDYCEWCLSTVAVASY